MPTIPQPPPSLLLGNLKEMHPENPAITFERLQNLYGDIFYLQLPAGSSMNVLCNHELVHFCCDSPVFRKQLSLPLVMLRAGSGDGLFTARSDEPNWKLAHRLLTPAFGPLSIRGMYPQMLDIAQQMISKWERFQGEELDVADQFSRLTLDTIALTSFDLRFNSFYKEEMHPFIKAMNEILEGARQRTRRPPFMTNFIDSTFPTTFYKACQWSHEYADGLIAERRKHPQNDVDDLLNRMLNARDHETGAQLSDENIRYQLLTFLAAGHETTSGLLSFAVYYMIRNPETMLKARQEADTADLASVEGLSKLVYIEALLKETLRLKSTAPLFFLENLEAVTLPGGYHLPPLSSVAMFLDGLHKDPRVWQSPVEAFRPERFLGAEAMKIPTHAWKPFGTGERSCIGRGFAMQEAILAVALVLRKFDLEFVDPQYDLQVKANLTIKPEGCRIFARPRAKSSTDALSVQAVQSQHGPVPSSEEPTAGTQVTIAYGSNSGSCEAFANMLGKQLRMAGFSARIVILDAVSDALSSTSPLIIITASYEGRPCNNAKIFQSMLEAAQPDQFKGLQYAVFGCGHRDWRATYQKIPTTIDMLLEENGGSKIHQLGVGDAAGDLFGAFEEWQSVLLSRLQDIFPSSERSQQQTSAIELIPATRNIAHIAEYGRVRKVTELVQSSALSPAKYHIEIELPEDQTYNAGDYLAISPFNPPQQIERVMRFFKLSAGERLKFQDAPMVGPSGAAETIHNVEDFLRGHIDLAAPVTKSTLSKLARCTSDQATKQAIEKLQLEYSQALEKRISIIDVLQLHPLIDQFTFTQFVSVSPMLKIRQYSISSSALVDPACCSLSFDLLRAPALSGLDEYRGVASNYLASLTSGSQIACSVRSSSTFRLPDDIDTPIVMFAAGSGIAPFRGFIQERAAQRQSGRTTGSVTLFYGCRTDDDFMYRGELLDLQAQGILDLHVAYSRKEKPQYVQDLVLANKELMKDLWLSKAMFYTCGSASKLAKSLKVSVCKIIEEYLQLTPHEAEEQLEKMIVDRYAVDVFG